MHIETKSIQTTIDRIKPHTKQWPRTTPRDPYTGPYILQRSTTTRDDSHQKRIADHALASAEPHRSHLRGRSAPQTAASRSPVHKRPQFNTRRSQPRRNVARTPSGCADSPQVRPWTFALLILLETTPGSFIVAVKSVGVDSKAVSFFFGGFPTCCVVMEFRVKRSPFLCGVCQKWWWADVRCVECVQEWAYAGGCRVDVFDCRIPLWSCECFEFLCCVIGLRFREWFSCKFLSDRSNFYWIICIFLWNNNKYARIEIKALKYQICSYHFQK